MTIQSLPPGIGLSVSEKMSGTFKSGASATAPLECALTITFDDLGAMFASADHAGRIAGKVIAPTLSKAPLAVAGGSFKLFVDDPYNVNTRELRYMFVMQASEDRAFYFEGVKTVRDDAGLDAWADTTTLAITIRDGDNINAPVLGTGVLHLPLADFADELRTFTVAGTNDEFLKLRAIGAFGLFFAGRLYLTYGGVFIKTGAFDPSAPPRRRRSLDTSLPETHFADAGDGVVIKLTRYRGGAKGPVLLVHGLGVSSLIFSMDTIRPNLLEYLFGNNYDVWLLDYRSSVDLPYAHRQYTADDVALKDYPAAIKTLLDVTKVRTVQVVVHCFGATTFFMAMLAGLQGVRSAVVSQIAAHVRVPMLTMAKAIFRVPQVLDVLGVKEMTTDVRTDESFLQQFSDLMLKLYPVHAGPRDTSVVSRRISFIYGQLYEIDNLNQETYDNLHEMFGIASIASLEHLSVMIRAGKIVDAHGGDFYLREFEKYPTLYRLAIPITIIHGELNKCWNLESTANTYDLLRSHNQPTLYNRVVVPRYGHIDCIFGKNASSDVYPYILAHLEHTATAE